MTNWAQGPLALDPGPRTRGDAKTTMDETAKRAMNETTERTMSETATIIMNETAKTMRETANN